MKCETTKAYHWIVSGNTSQALWQISLTLSLGFSTLQARATAP